MQQDPALLLQTPEQWPLWPEIHASFCPNYFVAHELPAYALQNRKAIMLEPCSLQPTPNLMLADFPPSAPSVPDVGYGLGPEWCMDLATNDSNISASYSGSSRDYPHPGPKAREIAESPWLPLLDDGALVSIPIAATTRSSGTSHDSTRQQSLQTSSFQVHLQILRTSGVDHNRMQRSGVHAEYPKKNTHDAVIQPSKTLLPVKKAVSRPGTLQASVQARGDRGDGLLIGGAQSQHHREKRTHSTTPGVSPSSDEAGGLRVSAPVTRLSRPPRRAAPLGSSQGQLPYKKPLVAAVPRGRRDDAASTSARY